MSGKFPSWYRLALLLTALAGSRLSALELQVTRSAPTDLAISGLVVGVPAGETRYLRWSELRALPVKKIKLTGEFVKGEQEVTALMLSDLWAALPKEKGADVLFATCNDGYTSIFRDSFIATYAPFVVLEINGERPEKWPPPGLKFNPGPYVITVSAEVVPAVSSILDVGHKKPWGVSRVEVGNFADKERSAFSGKWSALSSKASTGREIWINSCASCHPGPGSMVGGTKSGRPFEVIAAHAGYNQAYFKKYVRAPTSVLAGAKMEAHPHYTDEQLDELIAFITADGKP